MTQSVLSQPTRLTQAKVTIREVASASGVSIGTVSRALKNQDGLSEETRQQVLSAAQKLGYDTGNLRQAKIRRITFITTRLTELPANPFYGVVLHGAEDACREQEIALSYTTLRPHDRALDIIRRHESDGLILANFIETKLLERIAQLNLPMVLVDHSAANFASVNMDNQDGAKQAVKHLLEQGRKRIAFLDGPPHHSIFQRAKGFRQALFEAQVPADPDLEARCDYLSEPYGVRAVMKQLLGLAQPMDAVFCWNDLCALDVLRYCQEIGLRVPEDLAIVGFDDIDLAQHSSPGLSTIHVDKEALGRKAVEMLLEKDESQVVNPVRLVVRESSRIQKKSYKSLL